MLAVDCVMNHPPAGLMASRSVPLDGAGKDCSPCCERALVLGRPPGHHAGPNGCVASEYFYRRPDMTSSGFCLLNTVGVAAGYARAKYGREQSGVAGGCGFRVAIVDIDVHHGNGTEEIVRNLK
jgi:acetoin utilization deacetylase AcuC-like enzyme